MALYKRVFVFFIILLTPIISCLADTKLDTLSIDDYKAVSELLDSIKVNNKPKVINLTIPSHKKGYIALLRYGGITEQKYPDVFKDIETIKAKQHALIKSGKSLEIHRSNKDPENFFGQAVIVPSKDYKSISATVFNSLYYPDPSLPSSFQDTLVVFALDKDKKSRQLIASGSSSIEGKEVRSHTTEAVSEEDIPNGINNPNQSSVIAVSTYQGKINGISISDGPIMMKSNILDFDDVPKEMYNTAPTRVKNMDPDQPIIVCLNRENSERNTPDACDYGPMTPKLPNKKTYINMEIIGSVEFHDYILIDENRKPKGTKRLPIHADLTLVGLDTGGGCKVRAIDENIFWEHVTVDESGKKLTWDFSKDSGYANFGSICWKNNEKYVLDLQVTILTTPDKSDKQAYPIQFTYTNHPGSTPSDLQFIYPPINIQYGCIAEGTLIDMADGSKKKVEDIRPGDKVLTKQGGILQVKSRIVGHDTEFVDLIYNNGEKVSLTPTHPVATLRGIVKADELKIGDTIYTRGGQTTLSSVKLRNTDPLNVYNFVLEKTDDKSQLLPEDALLFAGGILVGDNNLQRKVSIAN
ncbi:hypothetical protein BB987_11540 [Photorhabdus temperata]|uniref:Pretoxin HINT protein n=1 Tax=Photorhabdus khanii NC19 TaxID=1004151 RepID=W3V2K1_9GAMM|nr:Hint domain-containing protein [Photorhabdus khanii]ETS30032.1 Pretoxin HINT protein [Photorhabdus khanii NC19]OHV53879.1 hypothetical protein BB987_11540 [Photorhabdus temperata]